MKEKATNMLSSLPEGQIVIAHFHQYDTATAHRNTTFTFLSDTQIFQYNGISTIIIQ